MERIDGNMLRGHVEALVLSVLNSDPAHGFDVVKRLDAAGCGAFAIKEATVYPVLYRLEKAGWLQAEWEADTTTSHGPRRRVYTITPKGRRELERRRKLFEQFAGTIGRLIGTRP